MHYERFNCIEMHRENATHPVLSTSTAGYERHSLGLTPGLTRLQSRQVPCWCRVGQTSAG